MNLGFLYFIGGFLALTVIGLAIYFIYISTKEKEDPENNPILINFMSEYSDDFMLGSIDKIEKSETRTKIVFYPRDLNYIRMAKEDKSVIKPRTIFIPNKNLISATSGEWSGHRNILIALPPKIENVPEFLREHNLGKAMMTQVKDSEDKVEIEGLFRKRLVNQQKMMETTVGFEGIVQDYIDKKNELEKDARIGVNSMPEKEKKEEK